MNNLKPADQATRQRILGWAASYVPDRDWFIQKAIAGGSATCRSTTPPCRAPSLTSTAPG